CPSNAERKSSVGSSSPSCTTSSAPSSFTRESLSGLRPAPTTRSAPSSFAPCTEIEPAVPVAPSTSTRSSCCTGARHATGIQPAAADGDVDRVERDRGDGDERAAVTAFRPIDLDDLRQPAELGDLRGSHDAGAYTRLNVSSST